VPGTASCKEIINTISKNCIPGAVIACTGTFKELMAVVLMSHKYSFEGSPHRVEWFCFSGLELAWSSLS
jgi:hypothetical protein